MNNFNSKSQNNINGSYSENSFNNSRNYSNNEFNTNNVSSV